MKKIFAVVVSLIFLFALASCGLDNTTTTTSITITTTTTTTSETTETTLSILDTPVALSITDNIVSFESVLGATKYKLRVESTEGVLIGEYFISSGFNLYLILQESDYLFSIKAVGTGFQDSEYSIQVPARISNPNSINLLDGENLENYQYIRWMGRTYYDESVEAKYFFFTASGFEVSFYGTELKATFLATNYNVASKQPYLVALIDGEEDPTQGTTFVLTYAEHEYTIVSGLEEGYHTVKLLKRSEASDSDTALKSISTDGSFNNAPAAKDFKIEFIAASSSTGYGNLGSLSVSKTTGNSDGLRAFSYLTTYLLDADISIFSASGWGVTRGWNTGGAVSLTQTIPAAYEYVAINASNYVYTDAGLWDDSNYEPDVIVVNLGSNDFNASGYTSMTVEQKAALVSLYQTTYTEFLRTLNNAHPDAVIIVAYGLIGETYILGDFTLELIDDANALIGSTVVYPYQMEAAGTNNQPFGCNYHPNVGTGMNVAEGLAAYISSITGREITRQMISGN